MFLGPRSGASGHVLTSARGEAYHLPGVCFTDEARRPAWQVSHTLALCDVSSPLNIDHAIQTSTTPFDRVVAKVPSRPHINAAGQQTQ